MDINSVSQIIHEIDRTILPDDSRVSELNLTQRQHIKTTEIRKELV